MEQGFSPVYWGAMSSAALSDIDLVLVPRIRAVRYQIQLVADPSLSALEGSEWHNNVLAHLEGLAFHVKTFFSTPDHRSFVLDMDPQQLQRRAKQRSGLDYVETFTVIREYVQKMVQDYADGKGLPSQYDILYSKVTRLRSSVEEAKLRSRIRNVSELVVFDPENTRVLREIARERTKTLSGEDLQILARGIKVTDLCQLKRECEATHPDLPKVDLFGLFLEIQRSVKALAEAYLAGKPLPAEAPIYLSAAVKVDDSRPSKEELLKRVRGLADLLQLDSYGDQADKIRVCARHRAEVLAQEIDQENLLLAPGYKGLREISQTYREQFKLPICTDVRPILGRMQRCARNLVRAYQRGDLLPMAPIEIKQRPARQLRGIPQSMTILDEASGPVVVEKPEVRHCSRCGQPEASGRKIFRRKGGITMSPGTFTQHFDNFCGDCVANGTPLQKQDLTKQEDSGYSGAWSTPAWEDDH